MSCKSFLSKFLIACLVFFSSAADAKFKFDAPNPSTEFEKMAYPQVYPTYSWEPLAGTKFYLVQVVRETNSGEEIVRELRNSKALDRTTDYTPFVEEGKYFWRVRVVDKKNKPLSDWSKKSFFQVTAPVTFAVLGDSISHGGANFIPAGQLACQWETFCRVPVKNIARSGDTTAMMIERFERDVLPFSPKVLLIIGGVNDIREGGSSAEVIKNLETLSKMCEANGIIPAFGTLTPMNEKIIHDRKIFLAGGDWKGELKKVNAWILEKKYSVDISKELFDDQGELREEFTPDGLHPNLLGKKIMGEAVEKFLSENFSALVR